MQFGDMSISKLPVGTFQVILKNHKNEVLKNTKNLSQGPTPTIGLPRPTHPPHYPPQWFSCGRSLNICSSRQKYKKKLSSNSYLKNYASKSKMNVKIRDAVPGPDVPVKILQVRISK